MTDRVVLNRTNTELVAANTQKKRQAQHTGIQYDCEGPRVLYLEYAEEWKRLAKNKKKDKEAKRLARKEKQDDRDVLQVSKNVRRLGSDLIYGPNLLISKEKGIPRKKNTTWSIQVGSEKVKEEWIREMVFRPEKHHRSSILHLHLLYPS